MIDWIIAGLFLALIVFAYWVGTGRLPGQRAWFVYRYARNGKMLGRRAALVWTWHIWSPWL